MLMLRALGLNDDGTTTLSKYITTSSSAMQSASRMFQKGCKDSSNSLLSAGKPSLIQYNNKERTGSDEVAAEMSSHDKQVRLNVLRIIAALRTISQWSTGVRR